MQEAKLSAADFRAKASGQVDLEKDVENGLKKAFVKLRSDATKSEFYLRAWYHANNKNFNSQLKKILQDRGFQLISVSPYFDGKGVYYGDKLIMITFSFDE